MNIIRLAIIFAVAASTAAVHAQSLESGLADAADALKSHRTARVAAAQAARAAVSDPSPMKSSGVILEGEASPELKAALISAMTRIGRSLPSGVELTVRSNTALWGDNPQIWLDVDGRRVYSEYLYHSEANLARLRRSPLKPGTWLIPSEPSPDLSKRLEAALRLAREGAEAIRARRPK